MKAVPLCKKNLIIITTFTSIFPFNLPIEAITNFNTLHKYER